VSRLVSTARTFMDILTASKRHSVPSFVEVHTVDFSISTTADLLWIILGKELCESFL
jgi:hypothetical protein